jgi:hypothetical protein
MEVELVLAELIAWAVKIPYTCRLDTRSICKTL